MIKSLTLFTLIVGMYQNPTYALLIAIALVLVIDLIYRLPKKERVLESNYEGVKEIFNNLDSKDYIEPKVTDTKLEVVPVDFTFFSYRDVQVIAKALGITGRNRKRLILEQELLAVCNQGELWEIYS